ncbi:MATE family efflux transporter [Jeotgalibaca caeni]|uniref:MATE family efflux transporter n=1 Tax=Jeotgalibaca caeni TaxID=3028623 RepID=UPI00237E46A6|nr:MATE family efflux transporter [Jeotgalibaca caeni]MDE1549419.1 MATE family efflux transporter [Jeotgalibaca caeni]
MQLDMTHGNISKHLIRFSVPMVLGNLIQLSYNALDSIIVSRFVGKHALAAVGTANPIMTIIILGISGICIGASVLMSEFYGAKDYAKLRQQLSTTLLFGMLFSVFILFGGLLLAPVILQLLQVPANILGEATLYFRIILFGFPFTFLYNALAAALRSLGNSKTPLYFLTFSSLLNTALDVVFVAIFGWGIAGAAWSTVIAEVLAGILCLIYIYRHIEPLQIKRDEWRFNKALLKTTLNYGSVTALQQAAQPIGKLLIQGKMNTLGVDVIAVFNAVNRIDDFAFTPQQSISNGITVFMAQNRGAKQKERMQQGFFTGLRLETIYWLFICGLILLFQRPIMEVFVSAENQNLVEMGMDYLSLMAFFYLWPAYTNGLQGYFRGIKKMQTTLVGTVIQISFRVLFVYLLVPRLGLTGVAFASMLGWTVMLLYQFYSYRISQKQINQIMTR